MSGVYIHGMEMPKSCFYCSMRLKVDPDTIKCLATGERFDETFAGTIETRNRGNCPLIAVPNHGRLIDADKFDVVIYQGTDGRYDMFDDGVEWMLNKIDCAPTIIEADKED